MTVRVQLFGAFSEKAPTGNRGEAFSIRLPEGSLVMDLVKSLDLPGEVEKVILVNGRKATADRPLREGEKVSIFPPTVGG